MRRVALSLACALAAAPCLAQGVVTTRTLPAGTIVRSSDIRIEGASGGAEQAIDELVGQETRHAIYAGRPLSVADLGPPTLVRRNEIVTMRYRGRGLDIRVEGRALDQGGAGERIRVLNLGSRNSVIAKVSGPSQVEVSR